MLKTLTAGLMAAALLGAPVGAEEFNPSLAKAQSLISDLEDGLDEVRAALRAACYPDKLPETDADINALNQAQFDFMILYAANDAVVQEVVKILRTVPDDIPINPAFRALTSVADRLNEIAVEYENCDPLAPQPDSEI